MNTFTLIPFLTEKRKALGTSVCPLYRLAVSAEANLKTVKLATS